MDMRIQIHTTNDNDHKNLMALLVTSGFEFDDSDEVEAGSIEDNHNYGKIYPFTLIYINSHRLGGNYENYSEGKVYEFPKDFAEIYGIITSEKIIIKGVGDYDATVSKLGVQVGCQTISLDKVREIQTAIDSLCKQN